MQNFCNFEGFLNDAKKPKIGENQRNIKNLEIKHESYFLAWNWKKNTCLFKECLFELVFLLF